MGSPNTIQANNCDKRGTDETSKKDIEVYFGIFFDGTGNNKFQTMLGKKFRLDRMYQQYLNSKYKLFQDSEDEKKEIINNGNDILKKGRGFWEDKNVFTASELDKMFFGYNEKDNGVIEARIVENTEGWDKEIITGKSDSIQHNKSLAARPDSAKEVEIIKNAADQTATGKKLSEKEEKDIKTAEGAIGQDTTYSNIAILESCYQNKKEDNKYYIPIYVEGSGTDMQIFSPIIQLFHQLGYSLEGLAMGSGFTGVGAKIEKMIGIIQRKIRGIIIENSAENSAISNLKVCFDVFGFSRGATEARIFTHIANLSKNNKKNDGEDTLNVKELGGYTDPFLKEENKKLNYSFNVRFLGIMDTVSSIGIIRFLNPLIISTIGGLAPKFGKMNDRGIDKSLKGSSFYSFAPPGLTPSHMTADNFLHPRYHDKNAFEYGLYDTTSAESVFHICALDEFRRNFALVDIESSINSNGLEVFLPGCHTDIGGAACIGRDAGKLINISIKEPNLSLGGPKETEGTYVLWPSCNHFDSNSAVYYYISSHGLEHIGLINRDEFEYEQTKTERGRIDESIINSIDDNRSLATSNPNLGHYVIYHYSYPGYSNISLELMYKRYKKKVSDAPMTAIPLGYHIPDKLNDYYAKFSNIINNETGRYFVSPDESTYRWLRQNYLHISANDQWLDVTDNRVVNGPSHYEVEVEGVPYDHKVIGIKKVYNNDKNNNDDKDKGNLLAFTSRIIYSGTNSKGDDKNYKWTFLFNYNPGKNYITSVSCIVGNENEKESYLKDSNIFAMRDKNSQQPYEDESLQQVIVVDENGKKLKRKLQKTSSGDYIIIEEQELAD